MKLKMLVGGALLAPFISIPHALSAHHEEAVAGGGSCGGGSG
jgi:hypothetical protein